MTGDPSLITMEPEIVVVTSRTFTGKWRYLISAAFAILISQNALDLKGLKEFQGHVGRMDQASNYYLLAIFRAPAGFNFCPGADLLALAKAERDYRIEFHKTAQETAYKMATMKTLSLSCLQVSYLAREYLVID